MFDLITGDHRQVPHRDTVPLFLSIATHVVAIAAVAAVPLLYATASVPQVPDVLAFVVAAPAPLPPPPPPAPTASKPAKPIPKAVSKPVPTSGRVAPVVAPTEITREVSLVEFDDEEGITGGIEAVGDAELKRIGGTRIDGKQESEFRREAVELAVDGAEEGRVVAEQPAVLPSHVGRSSRRRAPAIDARRGNRRRRPGDQRVVDAVHEDAEDIGRKTRVHEVVVVLGSKDEAQPQKRVLGSELDPRIEALAVPNGLSVENSAFSGERLGVSELPTPAVKSPVLLAESPAKAALLPRKRASPVVRTTSASMPTPDIPVPPPTNVPDADAAPTYEAEPATSVSPLDGASSELTNAVAEADEPPAIGVTVAPAKAARGNARHPPSSAVDSGRTKSIFIQLLFAVKRRAKATSMSGSIRANPP